MVEITGTGITANQLYDWSHGSHGSPGRPGRPNFVLAAKARAAVEESRSYIARRLAAGEVMYGVNTGFGSFSSVRIEDSQIEELQKNIVRSHSTGVGQPFSRAQTRAIMILRANALARGHSGVRPAVIEKILEFLHADVLPVIPSQGSVGASGDLAPLSHLALALIGEGEAWPLALEDAKPVPVAELLAAKKIQPVELRFKEGLSLINGCQVMTAIGLLSLVEALDLSLLADVAGAMSLEALRGSRSAFDDLISASRPHTGERQTAARLRGLLGPSSEIGQSHIGCSRVQDAYSLRCMPAVHGAAKDALRQALATLEVEANSSTDNPLVFAKEEKILSCGNFHGMPVALAMDFAGIALSAMGSISEQRIAKLINPTMSGLPAHLALHGGLNSGHMIVQVSAASLVSENKVLAHPASVDSIPTNLDKEDHVSMGTIAARKFERIVENVRHILAMEFLSACQGIDLLRPLKTSQTLEGFHAEIRQHVPFAKSDRVFSKDILKIADLIRGRALVNQC
ncbi:MAG: histidine ammonia-lyase [Bdellovibrio sp.]|nr:MAG: histidine ammonia-lyase [Bdellovibrio sp.]